MLGPIWNTLLFYPLVNGLIWLYLFTGNLGLSIILFTVLLRLVMTPLVLPGLKLSKKMAELAPELAKLKEQHQGDKQALALAQANLYKAHGANPISGCLPQVIQLIVLIALFNALNLLLGNNGDLINRLGSILYSFNRLPSDFNLTSRFLYLDLVKPDTFRLPNVPLPLPGPILLLSAAIQFLSGKMMTPLVAKEKKIAEASPEGADDAMVAAQQQMLYFLPVMTLIFGFQFPSGLVLYWLIFSAIAMVQQYTVSGWGGLQPWISKVRVLKFS